MQYRLINERPYSTTPKWSFFRFHGRPTGEKKNAHRAMLPTAEGERVRTFANKNSAFLHCTAAKYRAIALNKDHISLVPYADCTGDV